jgi:Uma2 family endonuclease
MCSESMPVTTRRLTVEEFDRLQEPANGLRRELHHGQLVEFPPGNKLHTYLQKRLEKLLESAVKPSENGVDKEFPFRPIPEYEVWVADVAVFSLKVWDQTADDDYFPGVPAIVIEVLSPSNSVSEILDREEICLRHGGHEFWLVDPQRQSIKVIRADGYSATYDSSCTIESAVLEQPISVNDVFAPA